MMRMILKKLRKPFLLLLIVPIFLNLSLPAQDDKFTLKEPYQLISKNDLKEIEYKNSDTPEKIDEKITKILLFIETYYSQFPEDRRTDSERKRAGEYLDPK